MSGGGGGGSGNQTTRIEPPNYQLPYLQSGLSQAQGLYNQGPRVVPFAPQTEAALAGMTTRASQGSPLNTSAQNYTQQTLQGGFLGSNPYLDATFNRAALATQNQLDSQYARAGRNVSAGQPIRAQQLNDLATSIYGGAYENERNRQQQVLPLAPTLANQDYLDLDRLRGVGAEVEGLAGQYADAPGNALDDYLRRVQGNIGSTQTTSVPRNRAAGAAGGALTGYGIGSQFGPYGGLLGALGGGLLGYQ